MADQMVLRLLLESSCAHLSCPPIDVRRNWSPDDTGRTTGRPGAAGDHHVHPDVSRHDDRHHGAVQATIRRHQLCRERMPSGHRWAAHLLPVGVVVVQSPKGQLLDQPQVLPEIVAAGRVQNELGVAIELEESKLFKRRRRAFEINLLDIGRAAQVDSRQTSDALLPERCDTGRNIW